MPKKDKFIETTIIGSATDRRQKSSSYRKAILYKINKDLMHDLRDIFIEKKSDEERVAHSAYINQHLSSRFSMLFSLIRENFPEIKKLLEKINSAGSAGEAFALADKYNSHIAEVFSRIITWAENNNPWCLEALGRIVSEKVFNEFIKDYNSSLRGDRPLSWDRSHHHDDVEKTKDADSVWEALDDNNR